jgi:hypothetical protein
MQQPQQQQIVEMISKSKGVRARTFLLVLIIIVMPFIIASVMRWFDHVDVESWRFAVSTMIDSTKWIFGLWVAKRVGDKWAGAQLVKASNEGPK